MYVCVLSKYHVSNGNSPFGSVNVSNHFFCKKCISSAFLVTDLCRIKFINKKKSLSLFFSNNYMDATCMRGFCMVLTTLFNSKAANRLCSSGILCYPLVGHLQICQLQNKNIL